jgi:hypothetical protein
MWILFAAVLAAGFAFSLGGLAFAEDAPPGSESVAATSEVPAGQDRQVVLYYFHGARRCKTCLSMEANALEVVKSEFAEELDSGALVWKVVNYDEPENEHFIKDFKLVSSSLKGRYQKYVHESVLDYLG